jgi:hypothetical protein
VDFARASASAFESIVHGLTTIASPEMMLPVVCLGRETFPLVTTAAPDIELPIFAGSLVGGGRVLAVSQVHFLDRSAQATGDTRKLILNAVSWTSLTRKPPTPVLSVGFHGGEETMVVDTLKEMGFEVEPSKALVNIDMYKTVVMPSDFDMSRRDLSDCLYEYVSGGGGLVVFYRETENPGVLGFAPMNSILLRFNLAFVYNGINADGDTTTITLHQNFSSVRDITLFALISELRTLLARASIKKDDVSIAVSSLCYHVAGCQDCHGEELEEIAEICWSFLRHTKYSTPEGIAPREVHGLVMDLIYDANMALPAQKVR